MGDQLGTTRGRVVVVGLAAIVVVAVTAVLTVQRTPTSPARPDGSAVSPPAQPLIVSAAYVRNGEPDGRVFAGRPVTVSAHALSERGVAALELWDGVQLVAVQEADPASSSPAFYARWQWMPAQTGPHTLFVRGVDLRGGVVQSNAVRMQVAEPPAPSAERVTGRLLAYAGKGFPLNLTAASAAFRYGIGVPTLRATLDGCQLQLSVTDAPATAVGIQLVGLAPAGSNFTPLMTLTPKASEQTQNVNLAGGGTFLFAASTFDASVLAYSPPVEVVAPHDCDTGAWNGEVSLVDGKLQTPQQVEKAYLYLTQGGGAAVRVPAEQGEFVAQDGGGALNFGPLLPPFDGSTLSIEAWGWKGGSLVKLGSGSFTPAPSSPPAGSGSPPGGGGSMTFGGGPLDVTGALTTLKVINKVWSNAAAAPPGVSCIGPGENCYYESPAGAGTVERPSNGSTTPLIKKFRWTTVLPNVSQFVWQILPYPPAKTADLAPPFMVDEGVIAVTPGQSEGEFSIDFNKYFLHSTPTLNLGLKPNESSVGPLQLFANLGGSSTPTPTPTPGKATAGSQFAFADLVASKLAAFSDKFYVRLVPIEFNSASPPSNPVTLDVVEPAEPIAIDDSHAGEGWNQNAYTIQWTYEPPVGPDPDYSRCALVTAVGSDVAFPWSELYKTALDSGEPLCYEPPSDDGWSLWDTFDAFVEFVSDVWDYVADGVDWVKDKVVDAVLVAVPCKEIASEAVCKGIANTALDAALIAAGVPPTLPDFDAVVAGLKGDLATFIVESAGSIPGIAEACGLAEAGNTVSSKVKTCEDLAGVAIDEIVEQVKQARSDAAGKVSGWAYPGVTFEPDPRGIWHPPAFSLAITRTSDPVLPNTCSFSVSMESTKKGWKFPELWNGYPKNVTADVSGKPLASAGMVIPPLAPGESISRKVWLTQPTSWFESQRAMWYWQYYEALNVDLVQFSRAWVLLTGGAELTFGVNSNCAKPSQQGPYVLPKSAYDN